MERHYPIIVPVLIFLAVFSLSCNRQAVPGRSPVPVFYPAPPDSARIQYLVSYGNSEDFTGPPSAFRSFVAGRPEPVSISKPYGLASRKGRLYIADPGSVSILIADMEGNTFQSFQPSGRGALSLPVNCNTDSEGCLYVADVERRQVVVFNRELEYEGEIGGDENFRPTDVFVCGDSIYVTDPRSNRILVFDRQTREKIFQFPEGAVVGGEDWLYNPVNLWAEKDLIYVTDFGHSCIKKFTRSGEFLATVGSFGRGLGQFTRPKGIAVDREGTLYAVDASFQNVQLFSRDGELLLFFGGAYQGPGDMYLPANVCIDYENMTYYQKYVDPSYDIKYLIYVSSQYGPDKVSVYGRIVPVKN